MKRLMKRKITTAAVLLVFAITGAFCGYRYYTDNILPDKQLDEAFEEQQDIIDRIKPLQVVSKGSDNTENLLTSCEDVNDDTVGWIYIPDTNIDLPVVQGKDNDFYLHNGVNGQYNYDLGCPFLDYRCTRDFSGFNSIVYGHHITNRRMFADISLFADADFMQQHPEGSLTLKDGVHRVRFFAYLNTYSTAPAYRAVFAVPQDKNDYISYIFDEAKHTQNIKKEDLGEDPHLLLLSTCTYEFDDARGILVGIID